MLVFRVLFFCGLLLEVSHKFPLKAQDIAAQEIIAKIARGEAINYRHVRIVGDLDLTDLPQQMNDAVYPEGNKTAKVYSNLVKVPVMFQHCTFTGKLRLCRKLVRGDEIYEYRVVFAEAVAFEQCTFEQETNWELANFDKGVSFAGARFVQQPRWVRMGLVELPNFTGLILEQKALLQFTQNSRKHYLTASQVSRKLTAYLRQRD